MTFAIGIQIRYKEKNGFKNNILPLVCDIRTKHGHHIGEAFGKADPSDAKVPNYSLSRDTLSIAGCK